MMRFVCMWPYQATDATTSSQRCPLCSQGAIRVFARVRPLAPGEAQAAGDGSAPVVRVDSAAGAVEVASGRCSRTLSPQNLGFCAHACHR